MDRNSTCMTSFLAQNTHKAETKLYLSSTPQNRNHSLVFFAQQSPGGIRQGTNVIALRYASLIALLLPIHFVSAPAPIAIRFHDSP